MSKRVKVNATISSWLGAFFAVVVMAYSPATIGHELITGWEGNSSRGYAFVSPAFTVNRSEPFSWLVRGIVSYLYYDYPDGGGRTKVRSPGESLGVALRYSGPSLTATISPGYQLRQTKRYLASGSTTEQDESGGLIQGDLFYRTSALTTLSLLGSYSAANDYVWVRGGAKRQLTNSNNEGSTTLHMGVEVTAQGNKDTKSAQIGPVLEIVYPRVDTSLRFHAGVQRVEDGDSRSSEGYFGIGLYKAF